MLQRHMVHQALADLEMIEHGPDVLIGSAGNDDDVDIAGGQVLLSSKASVSKAIELITDTGVAETREVINKKNELLVVSERYRQPGRGPGYKLPGGALQSGEHLADAAVREVFEETGVNTTFDSISFFRHWHGYRYGKSDIYFVAKLIPITNEIIMQEEEISECLWMPLSAFLNNESVHDFNKTIVNASIKTYAMKQVAIDGYEPPDKYEFLGVSD